MMNRHLPALAAACLLLGACSSNMEELQQWTEAERRNAKPSVKPLEAPKRFEPQAYEALNGVEPFSTQKLSGAVKQESVQTNPALAAELARRREPLEAFPLDSMAMVGSMSKQDGRYGILKVEGLLYYVKRGDHMGQNFGRVLKVDETEITLRELLQDASGDMIEKITTLQLQEAAR
ncbi:MAG: pilus assembly protein PilP [Burkholderiales bacterium]|uniref:pilus assembly protein PilP n=1 Tax=Inhella sp. TaxID=1921806 RepID=UPI001ACA3678|nr:pilus assembly protein PilP [Burkholderiales bacterium]